MASTLTINQELLRMFFKNLVVYRFTRAIELTAEQLEEQLAEQAFTPCREQELSRYGWVSPMGELSEQLVHAANGALLICAQKEEKVIPPATVKDRVKDKVAEVEKEQDRKVRKKEREDLKDGVVMEMLKTAFSRFTRTLAYIDLRRGLLVVDASSAKKAEALCALLRHTLGSLPVSIPALNKAPAPTMTTWLESVESVPAGLEIGESAELKDPSENGAVLRCRQQDLLADEIDHHLKAGKQVVKLALGWREQTSFVLGEDLILRGVKYADALLDQAADQGAADAATRFDADFYLLTETLGKMIPEILEALGGENKEAYALATGGQVEAMASTPEEDQTTGSIFEDIQDDPMWPYALVKVYQNRSASISTLQRELEIGYNRAARLIEGMEASELVTTVGTDGSRVVNMDALGAILKLMKLAAKKKVEATASTPA